MNEMQPKPEGLRQAQSIFDGLYLRRPDIGECREAIAKAFQSLLECYQNGLSLYICGNGGSCSDSQHIAGELMKDFERKRPLPEAHRQALANDPFGADIADILQVGFRAIPLGLNGALTSAILNDYSVPHLHYAQELYAMGREGDVLLGISTSGNAQNVLRAMAVAKAKGLTSISLTGPGGGKMAARADIALRLPGKSTKEIQESHLAFYHCLCLAIEIVFFPQEHS